MKTLLVAGGGALAGAALVGAWFFYQVHAVLRRL